MYPWPGRACGQIKHRVFRNGGQLAANEKWHIGTTDLNVVSEYTYLGIIMSTRLNSTCIQNRFKTVYF